MNSKLKQLVRCADEKVHALVSPMRSCKDENLKALYRKNVFEWKHTYAAWIRKNESKCEELKSLNAGEKSEKIRENLKAFLENNGEWVAFCTETGCFADNIVTYLSEILSDNSDKADVLYGDEDFEITAGNTEIRVCPFFKPDYSQETLLSFSYFGELIFLKRTIAEKLQEPEKVLEYINYTDPLTLYDIALKAVEYAEKGSVKHIKHVAFHRSVSELLRDKSENLCMDLDDICSDLKGSGVNSQNLCADSEDSAPGSDNQCSDSGRYYEIYDKVQSYVKNYLEDDANISRVLTGCGREGLEIRKSALIRRGLRANFIKAGEGDLYRICYDSNGQKVSIIILSKDNPALLEKCVSKIREYTDYPDYEIIVVDNGSCDENRLKYGELSDKYDFSYYHHPMEFNFSALCNYGVQKSDGQLILLMNDDVEVIAENYMNLMAGYASREDIGAVGARLLYGDGISIQHVGVTSLGIGPSHQLQKLSDDRNRFFGRNRADYEMIGVTAACLMVKRSLYEKTGGLDESIKVAFNDVDFCFRLYEAGYINVLCNGAVLLHHESLTRGFDGDSDDKWNRLLSEKDKLYGIHPEFKAYDPYYNEALIDNSSEYVCNFKTPAQDFGWRSEILKNGKNVSLEADGHDNKVSSVADDPESKGNGGDCSAWYGKNFGFRITIDHSCLQRRFNPEDEDFIWIDGWIYVPGADQILISKSVMLKDDAGTVYEIESRDVYRPDVEELLPDAKNIAMSGFLARLSPSSLPKGSYAVGIMAKGAGRKSCIWSERTIDNTQSTIN